MKLVEKSKIHSKINFEAPKIQFSIKGTTNAVKTSCSLTKTIIHEQSQCKYKHFQHNRMKKYEVLSMYCLSQVFGLFPSHNHNFFMAQKFFIFIFLPSSHFSIFHHHDFILWLCSVNEFSKQFVFCSIKAQYVEDTLCFSE